MDTILAIRFEAAKYNENYDYRQTNCSINGNKYRYEINIVPENIDDYDIKIVDKNNNEINEDRFIGSEILRVIDYGNIRYEKPEYFHNFLTGYTDAYVILFGTSEGDFYVKAVIKCDFAIWPPISMIRYTR